MGSQVTACEVQVFWDPCPAEKLPALRHGIRMLFDWLAELGTEEKDQELVEQG